MAPDYSEQPASAEQDVDVAAFHDPGLPPVVMPTCPIEQKLRGQTALVTGASSGIGKGSRSASVTPGRMWSSTTSAIRTRPKPSLPTSNNVVPKRTPIRPTSPTKARSRRCSSECWIKFGTVDILVNNAGLQQDAPLDEMTLTQWNKVISVNLTGQFLCSRAAVREFKRRGVRPRSPVPPARSSASARCATSFPGPDTSTTPRPEGGVSMMMKSIAQEVAPYRIRVNAISPGAIRTPINMQAWSTPEAYAELMKLVPYKRIGEVGRHRPRHGLACIGQLRLCHRRYYLHRWRRDSLSGVRNRRLEPVRNAE